VAHLQPHRFFLSTLINYSLLTDRFIPRKLHPCFTHWMAFTTRQTRAGHPFWFQPTLIPHLTWLTRMCQLTDSTTALMSLTLPFLGFIAISQVAYSVTMLASTHLYITRSLASANRARVSIHVANKFGQCHGMIDREKSPVVKFDHLAKFGCIICMVVGRSPKNLGWLGARRLWRGHI